eukprot:COSAG03_NODE_5806_length_1172_cov_7.027103_1_plen_136_part_01
MGARRLERQRPWLSLPFLLLLLIGFPPPSCSRKGNKSSPKAASRTRRSSSRKAASSAAGGLQAALVARGDPVLSPEQHSMLGAARQQIQEDMAGGAQAYTHLAQRALAAGELAAASSVLHEGLAVIGAGGGPEAEF